MRQTDDASRVSSYLHADGGLSPDPPGRQDPLSIYTFNPNDPVPTLGGGVQNSMGRLPPEGGFEQQARRDPTACQDTQSLASRKDVLVFETLRLPASVEVTGPSTVCF